MKAIIVALVIVLCLFVSPTSSQAWSIQQLTNNGRPDLRPIISGSNIAWYQISETDYEMFLYTGSEIIQLTDNNYDDWSPALSESHVAWEAWDGNDYEMFVYDIAAETTTQLTDNSYIDGAANVSGSNVTWLGMDGGIYLYDGASVNRIGDGGYPDISGSTVAAYDSSGVWLYDIPSATTTQVPNSSGGRFPHIDQTKVVWEGWDGNDYEVFLYDMVTDTTTQLTDNDVYDWAPRVSGSNVTWHTGAISEAQFKIYFYDGSSSPVQIGTGLDPNIWGSNVVWHSKADGDWEIMFFDGSTTHQLTDNDYEDANPRIFGSTVVWNANGDGDHEIFLARVLDGDTDGDGDVDIVDLGALAGSYGTTSGATWETGDFNGDGAVDIVDLGALAGNYGTGTGPLNFEADAASLGLVPEPASFLLFLTCVGLLRRNGR